MKLDNCIFWKYIPPLYLRPLQGGFNRDSAETAFSKPHFKVVYYLNLVVPDEERHLFQRAASYRNGFICPRKKHLLEYFKVTGADSLFESQS